MTFRILRSRLAVRLYLAGLAQLGAIVLFFVLMALVFTSPIERWLRQSARFAADGVCGHVAAADDLAREVARIRTTLGADVEVQSASGDAVAGAAPRGATQRSADASATCSTTAGEARTVRVWLAPAEPPPGFGLPLLAVLLAIIAGPAWLTARTIARPLSRLASAAHAFGKGDLEARAGLRGSGEIGEVASAFDQMANRMVSMLRAEKELVANVSHELRTPLARIRVALDLAAEGAQLEKESLADIARDLGELERIVSDVLAAARVSLLDGSPGGVLPLRLAETDVPELISMATARLRTRHPDRRVNLAVIGPLPRILADGVLLRRALENLLDNAATSSEGSTADIEVLARVEGERLALEVRDAGVGMTDEDLARAFEPFFRSDRSRSRTTGGLGLGLALTRRIVIAHGGSVRIASRSGEGTVVRIELPVL